MHCSEFTTKAWRREVDKALSRTTTRTCGFILRNCIEAFPFQENGKAMLVTNASGERMTPAVVTITEEGTSVGATAQVDQVSKLNNNSYQNCVDYNEINHCNPLEVKLQNISPPNVAVLILKELLVSAKSALSIKSDILQCVLLMPGSFSENYCEDYKLAAEEAGWQVLQVINEAAAAILSYSLLDNKDETTKTVIVYRLGGKTCEITGCEISNGMVTTLGSIYKEVIGGNLFFDVLVNYFADEFLKKYKLDPRERKRSLEKLKLASQNCVHILSNLPMANCLVESLHEGIDFSATLSRARFELLIKPIVKICIEPLQIFMDEFELNGSIDQVVLCGGGANTPSLQKAISSLFEGQDTEVLTQSNLEEVIAIGGAKQAYYITLNKSDCRKKLPRSMNIVEATDLTCDI